MKSDLPPVAASAASARESRLRTVTVVTKKFSKKFQVDQLKPLEGREGGMEKNGTQHPPTTSSKGRRAQCRTICGAALSLLGGVLLLPHTRIGVESFVCTVFGMYLGLSKR